jgi:hypothetical protein
MRNWGITPGHLADLKRMLQRTVDGQPLRPDGAATGCLQGFPYRLLAGRPAEGGFGLWAPQGHLVARGTKWATMLVEGLCPPVLHSPGYPPPPSPPTRLPEPEELSGGVCPMADRPLHSDAQATSAAAGPVPGWIGMARVVLLRVCPSIRCKPCCLPRSVSLKLLFLASFPLCAISA